MISCSEIAQARPVLHTSLMQRMTDVLSRMLNDPATRAALSGGGEDSLEGVIEQQEGVQNAENNLESQNAARSNESAELSAEQNNNPETSGNGNKNRYLYVHTLHISVLDSIDVPLLGNASSYTDRAQTTDADETANTERFRMREIEETRGYNQSTINESHQSMNTSANVNDDVSMETESSQINQAQAVSAEYTSSHNKIAHSDVWDRNRNENEASRANIASKQENMMENLQDRLTTMRDGFLER